MVWVYIMASAPRGTLYIGMTENLRRRAQEHGNARGSKFTRKYSIGLLVWFEHFETVEKAKQRERTMKDWPRAWKINLIERTNPSWADLRPGLEKQV